MSSRNTTATLLRLSEAAERLGLSTATLRAMDARGTLKTVRTDGNQRRVPLSEVERLQGRPGRGVALVYARCSTHKQTENLERQVGRLLEYATGTGLKVELFKDIGSGLNENRAQFKKLLTRLPSEDVACVIVEYRDRISRYGFQTFASYCSGLGVEVKVLQDAEPKEFEQELAEDMIALIASYSARLYGRRGGRSKKKEAGP